MNKSSETTPVNKHVRFSNFITYLGEPEPTFSELEESLCMDSSRNLFASTAGPPARRISNGNNGGGRVCKRQSLDLCDMFVGTQQNFGQTTVADGSSGGFSFGFSGSGLDLECSIREEDEDEDEYEYDDDIPRNRNIDDLKDTFDNKLRLKDDNSSNSNNSNNKNNNNRFSSYDDSRNNSSSLEFDTIGRRQKFGQSFLMCSFEKSSDSSSLFSLNSSSSLRMDKPPPQQTSSSDSIRSNDSSFAVGTAA